VTPLGGKGVLIISKGGQKGWYWHIVGGQWYVVWAKNMVKTGDQHTPTLEFLPVLRQQKDQKKLGGHYCRKSRNYQQSSWSIFDQAKTLSFSAVIKWLSAVL
jgi:hypothetical protein